MRHRKKQIKLGIGKKYTRAVLRNLTTSIILYEKVKTTKSRAKAVKPLVEKMITLAKKTEEKENMMNAIRQINQIVFDENAAKKVVKELKDRYKDRNSGYTRIVNLGYRKGDAASMVQIELI